ncbi:MAG: hypothetical protein R2685_02600 [Candidatus Nitrosocosmicus sp.]|nr:hypothetical protein [Candidatus Nitrosocosmicus sp.]
MNQSYATDNLNSNYNNLNETVVKNYSSYLDSTDNLAIVGSVIKQGNISIPQNVTVGIKVYNDSTNSSELLTEKPYNPVLYNNNEPFPFKFTINTTKYSLDRNSIPFVYKSENITIPFTKINTFELKYPVIPQGPDREFRGNITNTSPLQINDLTLYAIANDNKSRQIDSVKITIPILKPNQSMVFSFVPDPAIKDKVYFYSCVGGNAEDMRVDKYKLFTISDYKVLGYRYSDMMQLDLLNYTQEDKELNIKMNNLYPIPGALSIQIMPYQFNPVMIYMDGIQHKPVTTKYADNMIQFDMTVPRGIHDIVLSNVEAY